MALLQAQLVNHGEWRLAGAPDFMRFSIPRYLSGPCAGSWLAAGGFGWASRRNNGPEFVGWKP